MKSIFLGIFSLIAFSTASVAQNKAVQKAVIQTPGVQDEACKTRIDNFLVHEYGVTSVKADYRRHTVTVQWLKDRSNIENIKTALANMGYDADDVSADPDAYSRLPLACRHKDVKKEP
jgi:copper chaperone CopZ